MTGLTSILTNFLQLITRRGHWREAPRYFLNLSPIALKVAPSWERRRVRNFDERQKKWPLCRRFPVIVILGFLTLPLGTASADILYVTHPLEGQISVIDTLTGDVVTIPLNLPNEVNPPVRVPICIILTKDGTKAYVSTLEEFSAVGSPGDVVEIDTVSRQVTSIFRASAGGHPCVAISPEDGTKAYFSTAGNSIDVIDTATNTKLFEISTSFPGAGTNVPTWNLAFNPDGSTLYALANFGASNAAKIVGPANNPPSSTSRIQLFGTPNFLISDLAATLAGIVYITTIPGSVDPPPTILVFDANNVELPSSPITAPRTQPPTFFDEAAGIAITPDESFVYVALLRQAQVIVIDTATHTVVDKPIPVGELPIRIVFSPDGSVAYVTNFGSGDITVIDTASVAASVIDPTTDIVVSTIENVGGDNPYRIAISAGVSNETASLDHFLCYEAKGKKVKNVRVDLEDQFGLEERVKVKKPKLFCNPVAKTHNDELTPISDETAHLTGYKIEDRDDEVKRRVLVGNQFGPEQRLRVKEPKLLLVPSEMNGVPSALNLDHFKCYEAKGKKVNVRVDLQDQFEFQGQVKVKKPKLFCNPVDKNGEGIFNPDGHLTCYDIDDEEKVKLRVLVGNQFGREQRLRVKEPELLCVPSTKEDLGDPDRDRDDDDHDDDDDDHKKEEKEKDDD